MNLSQLAGVISDVQHGDKSSIPDSHHSKTHRHWKSREQWTKGDSTEVNTSSETYEELIKTIFKDGYPGQMYLFTFTHNVKNDGTLASRGATFKLWYARENLYPTKSTITELRWTDGLADYKAMSVIVFSAPPWTSAKLCFGLDWKVDTASYPCYSKNRFLTVSSYQQGGDYLGDT